MSDTPSDAILYGFKVKADPNVPEGEIQMRDPDTGEVLQTMTDTTDDAVKLTLPEAAALARKAGEDAARMRKEARDAEAAHMTTERQHTLVPCATCGTGDQPKYMVPVGDDWLCPQCAGVKIVRLREALSSILPYAHSYLMTDWATPEYERHESNVKQATAALGKEQP